EPRRPAQAGGVRTPPPTSPAQRRHEFFGEYARGAQELLRRIAGGVDDEVGGAGFFVGLELFEQLVGRAVAGEEFDLRAFAARPLGRVGEDQRRRAADGDRQRRLLLRRALLVGPGDLLANALDGDRVAEVGLEGRIVVAARRPA